MLLDSNVGGQILQGRAASQGPAMTAFQLSNSVSVHFLPGIVTFLEFLNSIEDSSDHKLTANLKMRLCSLGFIKAGPRLSMQMTKSFLS